MGDRVAVRLEEPIRHEADERGWEIVALDVMPDHVGLFVGYTSRRPGSATDTSPHS
ncbi:hypothetical protein ACIBU0_13210 [Streptomyces sp. NPDC049627]|uniref:hypothetical protein n=1 Tax=Streptomyces sp. NPDC049627 TaxID=3365595 RepID=UPI003797A21B